MAPTFVASSGGSLPEGALCVGFELTLDEATTGNLYVARVNHEAYILKAQKSAEYAFQSQEICGKSA